MSQLKAPPEVLMAISQLEMLVTALKSGQVNVPEDVKQNGEAFLASLKKWAGV